MGIGNSSDNFNPSAQLPSAQNTLDYSKGWRNNAVGTGLSGIAEDLDTGIKAMDRGVEQMAKDDVTAVVNDADNKLLGINNKVPSPDPMEGQVRQEVRNLEDKKLAMDNGTIDPEHYMATVMTAGKRIYGAYPGYHEAIDEEFKRLGIDPNYQRKEILAAGVAARNRAAASAEKYDTDQRELLQGAMKDPKLIMDSNLRSTISNNEFAWRDKNVMQGVRAAYLRTNALYAPLEAEKAQIELQGVKSNADAQKLAKNYYGTLQTGFYASMENSGARKLVDSALTTAQQEYAQTGGVSGDHQNALIQAWNGYRSQAERMRQEVTKSYSDNLKDFPDEKKKMDDLFTSQLDSIGDAIMNKDYGAIHFSALANEAYVNGKSNDLLAQPSNAMIAAANKNGGQEYVKSILSSKENALDNTNDFWDKAKQLEAVAQGNKTLIQQIEDMRRNGADNPAAYASRFKKTIDGILDPQLQDQGKINLFRTMFSPENQKWWDALDASKSLTDADRRDYARKMASPAMIKEVQRLAVRDPRMTQQLYDYTAYVFQKLNKDTASTINDTLHNSTTTDVTMDEHGHLVSMERSNPNPSTTGKLLSKLWETTKKSGTQEAIDNFNTAVDIMKPQWDANGIDTATAASAWLHNNGVDFGAKGTNAIDRNINHPDFVNRPSTGPNSVFSPSDGIAAPPGSPNPNIGKGNKGGISNDMPTGPDVGKPMFLGGPTGDPITNAKHQNITQQNSVDTRTGIMQNLGEAHALLADPNLDPKTRKAVQQEVDGLLGDLQSMRDTQGAGMFSNPNVSPVNPDNSLSRPASGEPDYLGGQPRGNPAPGTPTDEQQKHAAAVVDGLTGVPSFVEAVKSGDPKEIAKQAILAAASIIPFPAGKLGKAADLTINEMKAAKTGTNVIDHTAVESARVTKGLEEDRVALFNKIEDLHNQTYALRKNIHNQPLASLEDAAKQKLTDHLNEIDKLRNEYYSKYGSMGPEAAKRKALEDKISGNNTTAAEANAASNRVKEKRNQFKEDRASKIAEQWHPEEITKRIELLHKFKAASKDADNIKLYDDELSVLSRSREILKKGIKPVE